MTNIGTLACDAVAIPDNPAQAGQRFCLGVLVEIGEMNVRSGWARDGQAKSDAAVKASDRVPGVRLTARAVSSKIQR